MYDGKVKLIMRKKISVGACIASVLLCSVITFQATYIGLYNRFEDKYFDKVISTVNTVRANSGMSVTTNDETMAASSEFLQKAVAKISEVDSIFRNYYIDELDDDALIDGMLAGYIAGTGDRYGAYYNAEAFESFVSDLEGEVAGIGVTVIYNADYKCIEVISVVDNSPALEAGVQPGDLIVYVGENKEAVSEIGYNPAINQLRGVVGSHAVFTVYRGDDFSEVIDFDIERRIVDAQSVLYHVYALDDSIGVIKISEFDGNTPVQFVAAVEDLQSKGCEKLIIDLRYNPGGELSSIVTTLDYILPEGPIVRIFDADGNEVKAYYSEATELDIPLAVLVNGSTASAAELFTSAVRDYEKAIIVGTTTYGKGCMQTTIPLSDNGGAVSVTYRMYNPPFSDNYHGVGIIPDVEIELDESLVGKNVYKVTDEEDNQLTAAANALNNNN